MANVRAFTQTVQARVGSHRRNLNGLTSFPPSLGSREIELINYTTDLAAKCARNSCQGGLFIILWVHPCRSGNLLILVASISI